MKQSDLQRAEAAHYAKKSNVMNAAYWGWREPTHHIEIEQAVAQGIPRKLAVSWYAELDRQNHKKYRQKKKTLARAGKRERESEVALST